MQYTISHRMSDVHGSAIRELFKLGADPSMISFGGGNPSAETRSERYFTTAPLSSASHEST